jgi:hypothetical protein
MRSERDIYWKSTRVLTLKVQTSGEFHSLLASDELELILGIATDAADEAVRTILAAKAPVESSPLPS